MSCCQQQGEFDAAVLLLNLGGGQKLLARVPELFLLSELAPKLVDLGSRLSHVELGGTELACFFGSSSGHVAQRLGIEL